MKRIHLKGCRPWRARLLAHVDGELEADGRLQFDLHRLECDACRDAVRFHQKVEELLHVSTGVEPDDQYEDRIVAGVFARIDEIDEIDQVGSGPDTLMAEPAADRRTHRPILLGKVSLLVLPLAAAALVLIFQRTGDDGSNLADSPVTTIGSATIRAASVERTPTLDPDRIVPARLHAARRTVAEALDRARVAPDFRSEFLARTAGLRSEDWPVEEMVIAAINDPDAELARCAITGAAELALDEALPAVERATFRTETAHCALRALGSFENDRTIRRLERSLWKPELARSAADGLVRLGSAEAARILARFAADPARRELAFDALLSMGTRGVGELLRLRAAGDMAAAELLARNDLPTRQQVLILIETSRDLALIDAALARATECGTAVLPLLERFLGIPELSDRTLDTVVGIGGPPALAFLLSAGSNPDHDRTPALESSLDQAIRRLARATPASEDGGERIQDAARGPLGDRLLAALQGNDPSLVRLLRQIADDPTGRPRRRARAAVLLADAGQLRPASALANVVEIALLDEDAAALLLCAAAMAGADTAHANLLRPLPRSVSERLLKRAAVIAQRWRREQHPPQPFELERLSRLLADALPRI